MQHIDNNKPNPKASFLKRKMMRGSIKQTLIMMIMSVAIFAVGLTTIAISFMGAITIKETLLNEMVMVSNIVGERNKYLLQLGHQWQVSKNMEMFKVRPAVQIACIYDKNATVFAIYPIQDGENINEENNDNFLNSEKGFKAAAACPLLNQPIRRMNERKAEIFQPIMQGDEIVGWIYVMADLREVNSYINQQIFTAMIVIFVVFILSYLLTLKLQNSISQPMLDLAKAAERVSSQSEYTLHVINEKQQEFMEEKYAKEIVVLVRSINKMLQDIQSHEDELQRNYRELKAIKDQVESASIAKSQFLATISHELRTPLNAIIGFSTIIKSKLFGDINDKYFEYANDIHESGVHLLEIINDILDLSKAEADKLTLQLEPFNAAEIIEKSLRILNERAQKGKVNIEVIVQDDMPNMMADRVRYMQIILNLLSNAVKFTQEGGKIRIELKCKEGKNGQKLFHTIINDTGIGMNDNEINMAFQSFGQIDSGLDRKYEGTGLGLPLTKKLVELHGGTINITSKKKIGTEVYVIIPSR